MLSMDNGLIPSTVQDAKVSTSEGCGGLRFKGSRVEHQHLRHLQGNRWS